MSFLHSRSPALLPSLKSITRHSREPALVKIDMSLALLVPCPGVCALDVCVSCRSHLSEACLGPSSASLTLLFFPLDCPLLIDCTCVYFHYLFFVLPTRM